MLSKPENSHALIIGVGQRETDNPAMAVTATDAKKMAAELQNRVGLLPENIKLLTDSQVSNLGFLKALDELIKKTQANKAEMVWVYFSGHGCVNSEQKYYLICHNTDAEYLDQTAILGTTFVEKLQAIQTDKLLILLDCCHSGGITTMPEFKNTDIPFDAEQLLKKQPNRVVITASHATQVSFVSTPVSLFTFALIEGLAGKYFTATDREVNIFDLAMYIRERVYPLSKRQQQPQLNVLQDSQTSNFSLIHYPEGKPLAPAFEEAFTLLDGTSKSINTEEAPERDEAYRNQFGWLKVEGDSNKVNQLQNVSNSNITIDNSTKTETKNITQNAEKIYNIEKIDKADFS
jgi:uncharacterized caspase-like protein